MPFEAWVMSSGEIENPMAENRRSPNVPFPIYELNAIGINYYNMNLDTWKTDGSFDSICKKRGYITNDEVRINDSFPPEKLKMFFAEHIHEDEEVRFVLAGSGYFDVRNRDDDWVRIAVFPGDLIVVPAGIYHRFSLDLNKTIHVMRLFQQDAKWIALNRPLEKPINAREQYENYLKTTKGGPLGSNIHLLSNPFEFDNAVSKLLPKVSEGGKLYVLFTGTVDGLDNKSWCPDCEQAAPAIKAQIEAMGSGSHFLEVLVDRTTYLKNPEYVLRKHPKVCLQSIPTFLVFNNSGDVVTKSNL
eukprot:PhF_6_TR39803/c0_g1_i1/m.59192/K08967/mtnD, mtnZ, ADI1; 1,2-dihydroxy-3-keto-5-methylthiopentene dioxygenase